MTSVLDAAEPTSIADLQKGIRIPGEDFEFWLEKHDWTWQQLARNEFPNFHFRRYYTRKVKMKKPFAGLGAFLLALTITSGSIVLLEAVAPSAGRLAEMAVLVIANAVATLMRFLVLRRAIDGLDRPTISSVIPEGTQA